jgi:hypothetical protein
VRHKSKIKIMDAVKIIVTLLALHLDRAKGFNGSVTPAREIPSLSPLRVASTAWATSNDGIGASISFAQQTMTKRRIIMRAG